MKLRATAVPTVRWKWPEIHEVLWTTRFRLYEAFTRPPIPPKAKSSMATACAVNSGLPQGRLKIQVSQPLPPRLRPEYSSEATTLKKVSRLGKNTTKVNSAWTSFQTSEMPGSVTWWWMPIGTERMRNRMNDTRAIGSLNSLPPACCGTRVYQEM